MWTGIPEAEHEAARRLFLVLVRISRDGRRSSRRAATEEQLGEQGWSLAQRLVTTRIIVAGRDSEGQPTVELAHDALIDRWTRLRDWVDADRDFRTWHEELRDDHVRWQRAGQPVELLLRGDPLRIARSWLAQRSADLAATERDFITASVRARRSSGRRRQVRIGAFASVLVVALVATVLVVIRDRAVRAEQAVAASRAFAAAANTFVETDQARSALLALAAYRESPTAEARQGLFRNYLDTLGAETILSGWPGEFRDADVTRDGRVVVVLSAAPGQGKDRYLTVLTREPGKPLRTTRLTADPTSVFVDVTNDGGTFLLAGDDGIVQLNAANGERRKIVEAQATGNIGAIDFTDDGSIATAAFVDPDSAQRIVAWDLRTGRVIAERPMPTDSLAELHLAPDLRSLVVTYRVTGRQPDDSGSRRAEVWDMFSGQTRLLEDRLDYMKVTSDNVLVSCANKLVGSSLRTTVIVRTVTDGAEVRRIEFGRGSYHTCSSNFVTNRSGTVVAVSGLFDSLQVFNLVSADERSIVAGVPQSSIAIGAFVDEHGRDLALVRSSAGKGAIQIISLRSNGVTGILPADRDTTKLEPKGLFLVSVSDDGLRLQVTPSEGGDPIAEVSRPIVSPGNKYLASTVFSLDGSLLAHRVSPDRVMVYRLPMLEAVSEIATPPTNAEVDLGELFFDRAGRVVTRVGSEVTCWDPRTGSITCRLDLARLGLVPGGGVPQVSPLDDPNQLLVVVPGRTTVLTIDLSTGSEISSLDVGADVVQAARQGNSPYLAVARKNSATELWDVDKRRRVLGPVPEADPPPFEFATLLQPGSILIGTQERVALWRVGSESAVYSLELGDGRAGIDTSSDGSRLAVTAANQPDSAVVIDLRPEEWAKQICHVVAGRELTSDDVVGLPALSKSGPLCFR